MSIAGAEVGRPTSIDEVDAAWLTAVLRTSGTLGSDAEVGGVSVEPFAEGVGFLSLLHRATLTYDGPADGAPATVIIKMVTDLESQRGIADALQFYQRELRFYREIAAGLEFRTPVVHAAVIAEDSTDFVLVMEDLSELRGLDQTAGVGEDDAMLSVWSMAGLHAHFWGQDLADLETTFLPFDNPIYRAALPAVFAGGWETCKAVAADLLDPEVVAYGDRFAELVPFFIEEIYREPTLIHGDWRADNLLVDDNGRLAVIDFQITGTGAASYDLGYFLSQSLEPEVRRPINDALIDRYFEALGQTGVQFDREFLTRVFRLSTAWCLIYPVSTFAGWEELPEQTRDMARVMLRRAVSSIHDQGALALLPPA